MDKKWIFISSLLLLTGCAQPTDTPDNYGYHYTDTTPMGIKYRVDPGGTPIQYPWVIDFYFASVLDCTGRVFDPENLLIISTASNVNPDTEALVEGRAWNPTQNRPAMIVINSTSSPSQRNPVLSHELVHVFLGDSSHGDPLFDLCGYRYYDSYYS